MTMRARFGPIDFVGLGSLLVGLVILAHVCFGCGGPPEAVRRGTTVAALALVTIDEPAATAYTAAHERALAAATDRAGYDAAMFPWNALELALRTSSLALLTLDAALDAWEAGGKERWLPLAACAVAALRELLRTAQAVGLEIPAELMAAIDPVAALAGGVCYAEVQ